MDVQSTSLIQNTAQQSFCSFRRTVKKKKSRSQRWMFDKLNTIATHWEAVMLIDHSETGAPTATYKPPKHPSSYKEHYQAHTHKWKYAASTDLCTDPVTTCTPCNVNVSRVSCVMIYGWTPSVIAKIYFSRGATTVVEYFTEGSFSNQNLRTKCSIQTDFCLCNSSLRQQGESFVELGSWVFFLAFTFILAKYPSSDSVTRWHTSLENSVTPPKCLPDMTISVHTTRPVVHQQYNTEQWWGVGGQGGNTATAWNLGSDQNRPKSCAVIGT